MTQPAVACDGVPPRKNGPVGQRRQRQCSSSSHHFDYAPWRVARLHKRTRRAEKDWEARIAATGIAAKGRRPSAGETKTLCDIAGPGMIRHLWMTVEDRSPEMMRSGILRIYWDNKDCPSVEAPLGDFFGVAHGRTATRTLIARVQT